MHQIQNWDKSNLQEYLLYDNWEAEPALGLLAGFDYLGLKKRGIDACYRPLDQSLENDFLDEPDANATRLINSWERSYNKEGEYPPSFFIEWALSKQFKPLWLDWAIGKNLYIPKQEAIQEKIETANADTIYSTKWLEIQQAAIAEFFSPRRNVDAKRNEVVLWVAAKAREFKITNPDRIAAAIFTIIKPEDHSPRKRRVAPQKDQ